MASKRPDELANDLEAIILSFYSHEDVRARMDEHLTKFDDQQLADTISYMDKDIATLEKDLARKRAVRTVLKRTLKKRQTEAAEKEDLARGATMSDSETDFL